MLVSRPQPSPSADTYVQRAGSGGGSSGSGAALPGCARRRRLKAQESPAPSNSSATCAATGGRHHQPDDRSQQGDWDVVVKGSNSLVIDGRRPFVGRRALRGGGEGSVLRCWVCLWRGEMDSLVVWALADGLSGSSHLRGVGRCPEWAGVGPECRWWRGAYIPPAASRAWNCACGGVAVSGSVCQFRVCCSCLLGRPIRRQCTSSVRVHRHVTGAPPRNECSAPCLWRLSGLQGSV